MFIDVIRCRADDNFISSVVSFMDYIDLCSWIIFVHKMDLASPFVIQMKYIYKITVLSKRLREKRENCALAARCADRAMMRDLHGPRITTH